MNNKFLNLLDIVENEIHEIEESEIIFYLMRVLIKIMEQYLIPMKKMIYLSDPQISPKL